MAPELSQGSNRIMKQESTERLGFALGKNPVTRCTVTLTYRSDGPEQTR